MKNINGDSGQVDRQCNTQHRVSLVRRDLHILFGGIESIRNTRSSGHSI